MHELERLIEKFWTGHMTLEENRRLARLLEEYAGQDELVHREFIRKVKDRAMLSPERAAALLKNIHSQSGIDAPTASPAGGRTRLRKLCLGMAAAASVGIIIAGCFLFGGGKREAAARVTVSAPVSPRLIRIVNGPDSVRHLSLRDGSTVRLEKNSSLAYYDPFVNGRRDLSLVGTAVFNVAGDKTRPFTVYSGGIATTALGTRFLVNASGSGKVRVQLLEGKVVVNAANGSGLTMKDVYLRPGQEFAFDSHSRDYTVSAFGDRMRTRKPVPPDNNSGLVFRKEPLARVFKKIGDLYNVSLVFNREDMQDLYFTGTFLKSDDLNIVLSSICNVNDLHLEKRQDSIIITQSH